MTRFTRMAAFLCLLTSSAYAMPRGIRVVPKTTMPLSSPALVPKMLATSVFSLSSLFSAPNLSQLPVPIPPSVLSPAANENLAFLLERTGASSPPADLAPPTIALETDALHRLESAASVLDTDPAAFKEMSDADLSGVLASIYEGWEENGITAPVPSGLSWHSDLDEELSLSGLSKSQLALMRRHSAPGGFLTYEDFLKTVPLDDGGYLMGITGDAGVYSRTTEVTGLTPFGESFTELFGRPVSDDPSDFLEMISQTGDAIIFLVPRDVMEHPQANMTRLEMQWLLDRPERMKNVRFVFGAYDFVPESYAKAAGALHGTPRADRLVRPLTDLRGPLKRSPDATRLAQRRRHHEYKRTADSLPKIEITGEARREAVTDFFTQLGRASLVREKLSRRMLFFQNDDGFFILQEAERGYFFEVWPNKESEDKTVTAFYVSKTEDPELMKIVSSRHGGF